MLLTGLLLPRTAAPPPAPFLPRPQAHVRLIDALYALGRFSEADAALGAAVALDPSFTRQPEYKVGSFDGTLAPLRTCG
jgi:hypothetical protein